MSNKKQIHHSHKFYLPLLLIACLIGPNLASAATYYLDAINGNNDNPGTSGQPWQTLSKAQSTLVEGDTVLLRTGNYGAFQGHNDRTDWITFKADSGHNPTFTEIRLGRWDVSPNVYLRFEGITVTPGNSGGNGDIVWLYQVSYVQLVDMNLIGNGYLPDNNMAAVYMYHSANIRIERCTIYGIGQGIQNSVKYGIRSRFSHDVLIDNCDMDGCGVGVDAWGHSWTITNNHLHDLTSDGILVGGIDNSIIANNNIHNIYKPIGSDFHCDGIQLYNAGGAAGGSGPEEVPIQNLWIQKNRIYDIQHQGIIANDFSTIPDSVTFENNLIYNCGDIDVEVGLSSIHNLIFRNNIVIGDIYFVNDAHLSDFSNNILYRVDLYFNHPVHPPVTLDREDYNIINMWWVHMPGYIQGPHTIELGNEQAFADIFVDYTNHDYHLKENSRAIDFCPLDASPSSDLFGCDRLDIPGVGQDGVSYADAGCYEYGGTPTINQAPTAITGADRNIVDNDENGSEQVPLDGSGSSDSDGTIVSYIWQEEGNQIASGVNPTVILPEGTHLITLIVADDGGLTDSDIVTITISLIDIDIDGLPDSWELQYFGNLDQNPQDDYDADGITNLEEYQNGTDPTVYDQPATFVGHWKFDDGSGTTARDSSDNSNDGTLFNGPIWDTGKLNGALRFDGANDYVDLGTNMFDLSSELTVSLWVYINGDGGSNYQTLITRGQYIHPFRIQLISNRIRTCVRTSNSNYLLSNSTLQWGRWYHIALTYGNGAQTIYIDGQPDMSMPLTGDLLSLSGHNTTIGSSNGDEYLNGIIDEVRIYSRVLSANEIRTPLANAGPDQTVTDTDGDGEKLITLDASGSVDPDNNIANFLWEWQVQGQDYSTGGATPEITLPVSATPYIITLTVIDSEGLSDTDTVTITVNEPIDPNHDPVANTDSGEVAEDSGVNSISVLDNDGDIDGDTLTITQATQPTHGSAVITGSGTGLTYTPAANYNGSDSFIYTISDGNGGSDTATVNITVTSTNDNPIAANDTAPISEDSGDTSISVLDNDSDIDGDTLTITQTTQPAHGSVAITGSGTGLTYTPTANYNGSDSFIYTISDGNGGSDTATVNVTVTSVNDSPIAANDTASISEDSGANNISVLANDSDIDGDTLTITQTTQPENGSVIITGSGTGLTYTPTANYNGSDIFAYRISDGNSDSNPATVNITVTSVNDRPIASAGSDQTHEDSDDNGSEQVTLNGSGSSDPDGNIADYLWHDGETQIAGGATPTVPLSVGTYVITLTVTDSEGLADTDTVAITVNGVAPTGSLKVGIVPQEVVAEAQWRVDGGVWRNDEDIVSGIAVGPHAIDFKTIDGWRTPISQTVQVSNDQTPAYTAGIYFQPVISGYVLTSDSIAISDVGLTVSGVGSIISAANGHYSIDVPYNWSGTVSPDKTGYTFTSRSYNNVTSNKANQNFTGTEVGSLSVTLAPSEATVAGAQWSVDGGTAWHNSAVTISSLPVGNYTVEFKAVSGWDAPADVQAQITENHTTTTSGAYTQQSQSGSITVVIYPSAAIDDGARWRVDSGDWQVSSTTVDNLSEGTRTLEFNTIDNWTTPAGGQVQINSNQTTSTSATYAQQTGSMQVTISPQEAIDANAQWSADGGTTWYDSANAITLPTGNYTLIFKPLSGWTQPANQSVEILHNQRITFSGAYSHQTSSLTVTISPYSALAGGARWRLDDGDWQNSGVTLSGLTAGSHAVNFKPVSDLNTPDDQAVEIAANQTKSISGAYTDQTGSLTVIISPQGAVDAGARWRADGGSWHAAGATQNDLSVGTHTVEFITLDGWTTPSDKVVEIAANQTATESGTYIQQTGSLRITIEPYAAVADGAQWRVNNGDWRNSDAVQSGLAVGPQTVEFKSIDGWTATDDMTVVISYNQITPDSARYVPGNPDDITSSDESPPVVTSCSPSPGDIQAPLNARLILHIVDGETGVNPSSVQILVNSNLVYTVSDNMNKYISEYGKCRRRGTSADYIYTYDPDKLYEYDQLVTVTVAACDLAGNAMIQSTDYEAAMSSIMGGDIPAGMDTTVGCTYCFKTQMRIFGGNTQVGFDLVGVPQDNPVTVQDSQGNIWVAWQAGPDGSRDIYVAKKPADAGYFESSIQVISEPGDQSNPTLAVDDSGTLYLAWQDNRRGNWDIYFSSSLDGVYWSAAVLVTDSDADQTVPAIAVDYQSPPRVYIAWQDNREGNQDIFVAASDNGFATKTTNALTSDIYDQTLPVIAVDSDNDVYVVWTSKVQDGSTDIYGAVREDSAWTVKPLVTDTDNQSSPAIATEDEGDNLHLLWVDDSQGNQDIYYAAANDGLPDSPLTGTAIVDDSTGAEQTCPVIAVSGSAAGGDLNVFTCWQDERNTAQSDIDDGDIYFAESDGGSFGTNVWIKTDTQTVAGQCNPVIGLDGNGQPYVVRMDVSDSQTSINCSGTTSISAQSLASASIVASGGGLVGANPDNIQSVDDVCLEIPAGAFWEDVEVTISKVQNPPSSATLTPLDIIARYEFGPSSNLEFSEPVTITIPYSVAEFGDETVFWYNPDTDEHSQSGISDIEHIVISPTLHAIRFTTTHFTQYVIGQESEGEGEVSFSGSGSGGCSMSRYGSDMDGIGILEFFLPYICLVLMLLTLKHRHGYKKQ